MVAAVNITINQGETFRQSLVWKAGNPLSPVDLTGCAARMQVRSTASSNTVLASLTTEDGSITLGGADGTISLVLDDVTTSGFTWEYGVYDLEIVMSGGDVVRLIAGSVLVTKEVTR